MAPRVLRTKSHGARLERIRASRRFRDGVFQNTARVKPGLKGSPLPLLGEFFFGDAQREPRRALPLIDPRPTWQRPADTGLRVTWLGHSTALLELDGVTVLTDPVFGERASPLGFAGPRRFHQTPVRFDELPPLDVVLISHDHYDHLCLATARELAKSPARIVTSLGVGAHLEAWGIDPSRICELDWGDVAEVKGVRITATPAQHFSGRRLRDRNTTSWASFVLESARHRVFFSGDTGLTPEFRDIGARFGPFDLVMLEVGAFHEKWGDIHLGPHNALEAHAMLGSGMLLPIHWGTFNLALHSWDDPAETLAALVQERGVQMMTPRLGAAVEPVHVERVDPWWREVATSRAAKQP
ncbi:MAG: MBL fold metallo-hydrolase [Myxococcaceae bacterium]|nr:MBL fold metallo-hydrolase [Myxococcaceae bacterium]